MRIAFVGAQDKSHELVCTHWTGLRKAFKRIDHEFRVFCCRSNDNFVDAIIAWEPHILVYNLIDMAINEGWRNKLREKLPNTKIVFWYTDCRNEDTGQVTVDISKTVDLFLTSNDGLKSFQKKSFGMTPQWLPLGAEPLNRPVFQHNANFDFIFIGGKFNREGFLYRMQIIDELERKHGLRTFNGRSSKERAKIYNAMPALYGSATFTLDISHFWDIPKYTSNRYWVIPAYFGFALTKRFTDHEMLVPETHHVYWDTIEELTDKMTYYRAHEDERQAMIQKGWEYAKEHHTYEHRIRKLLEML